MTEAGYQDPVTLAPPTQPMVLTGCGHTVERSYLSKLVSPTRAYFCPLCQRPSAEAVRNFALEEALQLANVAGKATVRPRRPRQRNGSTVVVPERDTAAKFAIDAIRCAAVTFFLCMGFLVLIMIFK
jgi:hypothetical protein